MPETVVGTPEVEITEEMYKRNYAVGVCDALRRYDPKAFHEYFGGDFSRCVTQAIQFADVNFDKWKISWGPGLAARIAARV